MGTAVLETVADKLIAGNTPISYEEALEIAELSHEHTPDIMRLSNKVTSKNHEEGVYLCSIISAKTGACPEDCSYCAQSIFNDPIYPNTPFIEPEKILDSATRAECSGASEFCIVSSGRGPDTRTMRKVLESVHLIKENTSLKIGCSLGILSENQAVELANAGVRRYNHNLETSERFYTRICTTHDYDERVNTAKLVSENGIELCSGGIFGLGESWQDRIDLAFTLRELRPNVVPVNFLNPRAGTPLHYKNLIDPHVAIKIISLFRFILPETIILCGGGRERILGNYQPLAVFAGANSLITGDYLTTSGDTQEKDLEMIKELGLDLLRFT